MESKKESVSLFHRYATLTPADVRFRQSVTIFKRRQNDNASSHTQLSQSAHPPVPAPLRLLTIAGALHNLFFHCWTECVTNRMGGKVVEIWEGERGGGDWKGKQPLPNFVPVYRGPSTDDATCKISAACRSERSHPWASKRNRSVSSQYQHIFNVLTTDLSASPHCCWYESEKTVYILQAYWH